MTEREWPTGFVPACTCWRCSADCYISVGWIPCPDGECSACRDPNTRTVATENCGRCQGTGREPVPQVQCKATVVRAPIDLPKEGQK
jgi:hypothetical protein